MVDGGSGKRMTVTIEEPAGGKRKVVSLVFMVHE